MAVPAPQEGARREIAPEFRETAPGSPPAPRPPSHRLRFAIGVLLGTLIAVAMSFALLARARSQAVAARTEREALVSTLSLSDLVRRAGATGEPVRQAVAAWQQKAPAGTRARVLAFNGISLEASTFPEDANDKAAPRRLSRDEKPLYDRGQRLRAAVETNRDESGARKEEVEVAATPQGGLSLAAPVEADGAVTGMVEVETPPSPAAPRPDLGFALLALLVSLVSFGIGAALLGERRLALGAVALVGMVAGIGLYGWHSLRVLSEDRTAAQDGVAGYVRAQADQAKALLSQLGMSQQVGIDASNWDTDFFRHPRGLLTPEGQTVQAKLEEQLSAARGDATRAIALVGLLSALVMLAVGLGGVAKLWATLVTHRQAYAYIAPAMVGVLVLVFFPFVYGITLSFTGSNLYNTSKPIGDLWIGLKNYADILGDFRISKATADGSTVFDYFNFYWTLCFTVVWTVTNVVLGVTGGLILALVLNTKNLAFRPIYRVLLILPWAMPTYITALIWKGMFHSQFGVITYVLQMFGHDAVSWFQTPATSYLAMLITNAWLSFPFMMVVSLGALQSIPGELYEAARVDGAGKWQQFLAITLPSLRPALVPAVILSVVWTFNAFNVIYLVSGGEPAGATEILITQAFKFAFEKYRYGYAAAYSTVIFGILLVYGTFQNRVTRATEGI